MRAARLRVARVGRRVRRRERLRARLVDGAGVGGSFGRMLVDRAVGMGMEAIRERRAEGIAQVRQRDAVLRALRPGHGRHDGGEVEAQRLGEARLRRRIGAEHALRLRVCLDPLDHLRRAAGHAQVAERLVVDREERCCRAELRRHVADRRSIGEREARQPRPVELDELADHAMGAEHLGDGEDEVGGGRAGRQLAVEAEADDDRQRLVERLPEHRRLGLDAADAPADDAEPVHHRGVRIGPDQGVGEEDAVALGDDVGQELEVHLVDDAGARRDDAEVGERLLRPAEERVALAVALVLAVDVDQERGIGAELVDLHAVVDDEVDRDERVDPPRVAAHLGHRVAHRGEVDDARHAGEVLEDDPGRHERQLHLAGTRRVPGCERAHVVV